MHERITREPRVAYSCNLFIILKYVGLSSVRKTTNVMTAAAKYIIFPINYIKLLNFNGLSLMLIVVKYVRLS